MILRILRGRAGGDDLEGLVEIVRSDFEAWAAVDTGPVSALSAYRPTEDEVEFLLVSTWTDAEAVLARGGEITRPRGRLDATSRLRDARAQHYELMMGISRENPRPGELVRLSSIGLPPGRSSAFYGHVRWLWEELVGDAGLVTLQVGRRVEAQVEQALVVSVWESAEALEAATSGGFVGGESMRSFYATEPRIEHFTTLTLQHQDPATG